MSDRINDGGPAFPHHIHEHWGGDGLSITPQHGMTLRDYFAGQALAGIAAVASPQAIIDISGGMKMGMREARAAYAWADAMIAAREGGKQ